MSHYLNGNWVEAEDVKISAFDISLLRGYGAFEFLRTYNKKPFGLKPHLDRLFLTASEIGLPIPKTLDEISQIIHEGINKSPHEEVWVKIIVTGGISEDGILPGEPSLILLFLKAGVVPEHFFTNGVKLITHKFERYIPRAKSLNYMTAVVTIPKARQQGALDVLYISERDEILEGTTYNFYAVIDGKVHTAEDDILYGITRQFVLNVAKDSGIPVITDKLFISQMANFQEAFISSTTREVMPVVQIDDLKIGDGTPGPITKKLIDAFNATKCSGNF